MADEQDEKLKQGMTLSFEIGPRPDPEAAQSAESGLDPNEARPRTMPPEGVSREQRERPLISVARLSEGANREASRMARLREAARGLRFLVLSELTARAPHTQTPSREGWAARVSAASLDEFFAELAFDLVIELPDPFEPTARVVLTSAPRALGDLRPDGLCRCTPELRGLLQARQAVAGSSTLDRATVEQIRSLLVSPHGVDRLLAAAASARPEASAASPLPATPLAASPRAASPAKRTSAIDRLLEQVDLAAEPAASPRAGLSGRPSLDVGELVSSERTAAPGPSVAVKAALALLDRAIQSLLAGVLEAPEFHRLERAWRGLFYFLQHVDGSRGISVDVVNVAAERMPGAVQSIQEAADLQPNLIVTDVTVEASAAQLGWLQELAEAAADVLAPVLISATPGLLGYDSLERLATEQGAISQATGPESLLFRSFCEKPEARWVTLASNGPLLRLPYDEQSSRLKALRFSQDPSVRDAKVFAPAAYALAALVARSHAHVGHPFSVLDPRVGGGKLTSPCVQELRVGAVTVAVPLEYPVGPERQREAAKAGLVVLGCAHDHDEVIVTRLPMAFRQPSAGGTQPAALALADQMMVARAVQLTRQLASERYPDRTEQYVERMIADVLLDLFPGAGPSGPNVDVHLSNELVQVEIHPRGYGGLELEAVNFTVPRPA